MGVVKFILFFIVMIKIKAVLATFSDPSVAMAIEPMTVMAIGGLISGIAGGASSIFGGQAQGAAIDAANEQAHRNWIHANTQKTMNNAREQFQSSFMALQQVKRNSAIRQAAWQNEWDAKQALAFNSGYQQKQLATQLQTQKASLMRAILTRGVSASSGMYASMATAQALDALQNSALLKRNTLLEKDNIDKQTAAAMAQQTENLFMPNIQLYDESPAFGDADAARTGGMVSGALQIGSSVAGFAVGAMGSSSTTTPSPSSSSSSSSFNSGTTQTYIRTPSGGDQNGGSHPSGGAIGGR